MYEKLSNELFFKNPFLYSGAGQEVGRSCIMLEFKGKKIMLDCGIHPGLSGMDALPFVDLIEADEVDLLFISQ